MNVEHLFVYGTLRSGSGHPMHEVLAAAAEKVGAATVAGRLYRIDWFPGLVLDEGSGRVHGDLWRVREPTVFVTLDDYEGEEYERRTVEVAAAGERFAAFAYVFTAAVDDLVLIASGDWLEQA